MTPQHSPIDTADLRQLVAHWWQEHVPQLDLAQSEELALALSRQLAQTMIDTAAQASTGRASYQGVSQPCPCGQAARFVSYRRRWVATRCGHVAVTRAYYHCRHCGTGQLPWDREQGLNHRVWSPAVKALAVDFAARLPYGEAAELLERLLGYRLEPSSLEELVAEVGGRLRAADAAARQRHFDQGEPVASTARPRRLYVSLDAAKAHTAGSWHDIKVGAVYPAVPGPEGIDRMGPASYEAAQEGSGEFGPRLYLRALQAGLQQAEQVVVIGDGAEWIWNQASEQFGGAVEILDFYHASEHVGSVARAFYGEGTPLGERWARWQCRRLRERGPESLIRALRRRRRPPGAAAAQTVERELRYFTTQRRRMRYPQFRAAGLMIGSGPVEAGCKVIVGQRLKGAGMRWSREGADAVLAVRTALRSGEEARVAPQYCGAGRVMPGCTYSTESHPAARIQWEGTLAPRYD